MMLDEEDEVATAGLLYEAHKTEIEQAVPMASLEKEAVLGKGKAKNRVKGEEMFITLVHGDVLQLSGDDFEVRYHLLFEDGANHSTVVHEAHGHVDQ